jgi:hypothetical protein
MLSEYRQRFSQYHTQVNREDYLYRSGRKDRPETASIVGDYSDLFELSTVADLRSALDETPAYRETERASIQRLIAFALEGNLARRVREISQELEFDDAEDLRAERFEKLHAASRELGYENYLAMRRELRGVDFEIIGAQADRLLAQTESGYVSALAPLLAEEAGVSVDEAKASDLDRLHGFTRFDHFFPRERMLELYRELFYGLGFKPDNQSNVEIDSQNRPRKQRRSFCAPIRVPEEVKLVVNLIGGQENYREFLRVAGRAQHFAWTSQNLYPEFCIGGDPATPEAWGMLLGNLMLDEHWLLGAFGFVDHRRFLHTLSVLRLANVRRNAAQLRFEIEFHAGTLSGMAGPRFAELLTNATRVRFDESEHLRAVSDSFSPASHLRACAFESQFREYLKGRYGRRWWASRKAGETLIDLWNMGQRYTVEELAAMIGMGKLDFDWLISELLRGVEW